MPTYELSLTLRQDGLVVPGFPVLRRVEIAEAQSATIDLASAGDSTTWTALPTLSIDTLNFLLVATDQPITVRLNGASDAPGQSVIPLKAGGTLILIDATVDAGAGASNARVNNNAGATAVVRSFAGGT